MKGSRLAAQTPYSQVSLLLQYSPNEKQASNVFNPALTTPRLTNIDIGVDAALRYPRVSSKALTRGYLIKRRVHMDLSRAVVR